MNKVILFCSLLIVLVVGGCARDYQVDDEILDKYSAKYDSDILKQFENNSEVLVIAFLDEFNDERCYFEDGPIPKECITIYQERWKRNFRYENKVLSESAAWAFRLERKGISTPSLTGYVSKKGFEELIKHQNVSYIMFYDLPVYAKIYSRFDLAKDINNPRILLINLASLVDSRKFIEIGDGFGYHTDEILLHFNSGQVYDNLSKDLNNIKSNYKQITDIEIINENEIKERSSVKIKVMFIENLTNVEQFGFIERLRKELLVKEYVDKAYLDKVGVIGEN